MLKADFHIHTRYSMDCHNEPEEVIERCQELGFTCVAITDHDATEGAFRVKELAPFQVIIGEEVLTPAGEIMGLFLRERIASGLSVDRAIEAIHGQGGLVALPHPFDPLRGLRLTSEALERVMPGVDIIEVFNARCHLPGANRRARDFARKHGLPGTAGSDAHTIPELGGTYVELPDFSTPQEFLQALKKAVVIGKPSSPFVHLHSTWAKIRKAF